MSNTNTNLQIQTSNVLHNAIMEAGGKDCPPMLAPGNYVQWKSRIKRYIDTKPNNELIHYCLQNPPYKFKWTEKTIPVAEGSSETTTEGLKQGESINVQDLETNLYWEFGKFTSWDGESLESYYSRFYKMMNELVRNQCDVTNHQQHHNEVNELRAERLARTANPLALVAQQQPVYHPQNHPNHYTQNSSTRSQQAATRNRGKAIVNSPPPTYDQEPTMVAEDDEMSKEKEIDKLMALISLSFKKIYKPTNNNLRTSSNTSRANQDNTPRINRGTGYDNQRVVNVAGARENVGTQVVQQSGIQCYNCKEYGHVARECQKPKRAKDAAYHKEKMLLCKQEEAGFQLNAEQADWRDDTDDEPEDQELEAHYLYMAHIQEVQDDDDLAKERDLVSSLIEKLKCEIDESKNRNKFLESSNKTLVDKLKDLKKFQAELDRYHDVNYTSKMDIDCVKAKGDLISYKMESQKTKMPLAVPISTREPKRTMNQSAATPLKRIVATESTNQKPRSTIRKQYDQISKICKWWYCKITPPGYKWKPKSRTVNVEPNLVEIILFIVNSGCSKHMTGNLKLLSNFMEQFLGTVKFGNDQIAPILGYGDLVQGNVTIKRVYYVEGLNHNLFSVGQLCDADLEVAFQKSTCYIRDLKGNDLLTGSCGTDMYSITLQDTSTPNLICLMAKATSSQAWLWHRRLSHLNFDTINLLSKSKDGTPEVLIDFLKPVQRRLHAQVRTVRTDKGTKFLNKNLHAYFAQEGIEHQTSTARTPEQNGVVERRNRTLVEAARTMLSAAKMALDHVSSDPAPQCPTTILKQDSLSLGPQSKENIPHSVETVTTSNELDLLFSLMFDELLNGTTLVVSKSSAEELHQHGMTSCDSVGNPMATKTLDADLSGNPVDQTKYHSMVGALMYLTASRPDIIHATCYCARYQARPTKKKIKEVKWIFKYLKSTINMGLWYPKDTSFELTAFSDSDHAGCLDTHKSTYGGIQFLGGDKLVNWSSKKQDCTLMSSVEKGTVKLFFVGTEYQLADLFTKALSKDRSYALIWKPCQGDSLNLPDHGYKHRCCSPIPAKSDSLLRAHTQALKVIHST
ncbi:retrovirus-related pol polyprotein from transposon TNT 1-94 [Tanacetum coccineum]|uniref:Retrovirus-related pol polyprotein from transposon TNT 1-94 n=1 Tax=Tanacetum coccineum TaxID=301880 RepID=A0ABQ5HBE1_9ASTR